jgi:PAS domain S-box-containing protein
VLEAIIKAFLLAIIAVDAKQRIITWNESAERVLGWNEKEVLGKAIPVLPPMSVLPPEMGALRAAARPQGYPNGFAADTSRIESR